MTTDPYTVAHHIRAALATIQHNYQPALTGTAPRDDAGIRSRHTHAPPPVNLHILDTRAQAFADLHYYCRFILGEVNQGTITTRIDLTVETMCAFIDTWAQALAEQFPDDADQCRTDLRHHATQLRKIVNGEYTSKMMIKPCPSLIWHEETLVRCTGTLIAHIQHGDAPLPPGVRCTTNPEHQWAPHEWPALGRRLTA